MQEYYKKWTELMKKRKLNPYCLVMAWQISD